MPKGIGYMRRLLGQKRVRVLTRYTYYEMKNGIKYYKGLIPPQMQWMASTLGWCAKSVDTLADRLSFFEFRNDIFRLNEIMTENNVDILPDSAILSALISSCAFVYISHGSSGAPRLQVIDGANATGVIDPYTGLLTEGYAVLKRDDNGRAETEAYFLPGRTEYYQSGNADPFRIDTNSAAYAMLVPMIYRPDAVRPFGRSRISRSCMDLQQGALRTLLRSEVSAEFYSFPQKWVSGVADDVEMDKWRATVSSMLMFTKDEDGESPKLGQFSQQSMQPYMDQLKTYAALFAGETGLTLDDLGFVSDNPSSAEAIKASHENLRLAARKAQKTLGSGLLNVGYMAACLRDNFPYDRSAFAKTAIAWEPVFEPDSAMMSSIGDGVIKLNQAVPGFIDKRNLQDLTGITPGE